MFITYPNGFVDLRTGLGGSAPLRSVDSVSDPVSSVSMNEWSAQPEGEVRRHDEWVARREEGGPLILRPPVGWTYTADRHHVADPAGLLGPKLLRRMTL
jgi:hypothetical protein